MVHRDQTNSHWHLAWYRMCFSLSLSVARIQIFSLSCSLACPFTCRFCSVFSERILTTLLCYSFVIAVVIVVFIFVVIIIIIGFRSYRNNSFRFAKENFRYVFSLFLYQVKNRWYKNGFNLKQTTTTTAKQWTVMDATVRFKTASADHLPNDIKSVKLFIAVYCTACKIRLHLLIKQILCTITLLFVQCWLLMIRHYHGK